jgi:hypothetical protein
VAYPQPSSNDYATGGFEYFRLLTPLTSPGDIYESEQSGHALALGPQSDVANVNVAYFDKQVATFVNQTQAGPPRSFVGRIDANNVDFYVPSQRPGRILLWPSDLYDPTFIPTDFDPDNASLTFITPILDVIQYFKEPDSLVPVRNDKTFRFPALDVTGVGEQFLVIPYWGRKYACCRIFNQSAGTFAEWIVKGITYYPNASQRAMETPIDSVANIPAGEQHTTLVRAGVNGMFDALLIIIAPDPENFEAAPFEVIVSDTPA